jgi:hypothetical protein
MSTGGASGRVTFFGPLLGPVGMLCLPFAVVGGLAFVVGAKQGVEELMLRRVGLHTRGVVVGFEGGIGSRRHEYYPRVVYDAPSVGRIEFRSRFSYAEGVYRLKQDVDVVYDPATPLRAEVDSTQSRYGVWFMPGFVLFAALAGFLLYAVIFFLVIRKAPADTTT